MTQVKSPAGLRRGLQGDVWRIVDKRILAAKTGQFHARLGGDPDRTSS